MKSTEPIQINTFSAQFGHDESLVSELLELFYDEAPKLFEQLLEDMETADARKISHSAHSLKGAALNMQALQLAEYSSIIEKMALDKALTDLPEAKSKLTNEFSNVLDFIGHYLNKQ